MSGERRAATAKLWGSADYSGLARRLESAADALVDAAAPRAGRLAFTAWTSDGYIAQRARTIRQFVPPDPTYPHTQSWGDPEILEQRLASGFSDIRIERWSLPWHFDSPAQMSAFYTAHLAAYLAAKQAAGERADQTVAAIERQASPDGGPVRLEAEYLLDQALRS